MLRLLRLGVRGSRQMIWQSANSCADRTVKPWHENAAEWGFTSGFNAQTGKPSGRDWQNLVGASTYTPLSVCAAGHTVFDEIRGAI